MFVAGKRWPVQDERFFRHLQRYHQSNHCSSPETQPIVSASYDPILVFQNDHTLLRATNQHSKDIFQQLLEITVFENLVDFFDRVTVKMQPLPEKNMTG